MGGSAAAILAFVAAAAVLALLVFVFALVVARAQQTTVEAIRARVGQVKRYGGYVLIAVGAWTLALATFAEFFAQYLAV
jgi:hypothetical protein